MFRHAIIIIASILGICGLSGCTFNTTTNSKEVNNSRMGANGALAVEQI
jgi:hypothetical protein